MYAHIQQSSFIFLSCSPPWCFIGLFCALSVLFLTSIYRHEQTRPFSKKYQCFISWLPRFVFQILKGEMIRFLYIKCKSAWCLYTEEKLEAASFIKLSGSWCLTSLKISEATRWPNVLLELWFFIFTSCNPSRRSHFYLGRGRFILYVSRQTPVQIHKGKSQPRDCEKIQN